MVLTSGGNLGVGNAPNYKLDISGGGKVVMSSTDGSFGQIQIGNSTSGGEASLAFISGVTAFGSSPTSTNGDSHVWAIGANVYGIGGASWGIANKGKGGVNVYLNGSTATSWTAGSDIRLKDIVSPITGALEKILNITPVYYTWKNDETKQLKVGLIAQEVNNYFPEVVSKPEREVNDRGETLYWGITYSDLTSILMAAIKEQQTQINELKAEINILKNK